MLRLLSLFTFLASSAWCAATTVSDTIYNEIGGLANGTIYVTPNQQFKEVGGRQIYPVAIPAQVVNGILSIALYPNDTSLPTGTYYTASYSITNMAQISEIWIIPTSATPVNLDTIRAVNSPTTSFQVSLTQLLTTGCTNGQVLAFNGTSIACSSSGTGTVTHTLGALTLNQLIFGNGTGDIKVGNLTGDVTTSGATATTLATVNSNVGSCGDATHTCQVTLNAKGLATAAAAVSITAQAPGNYITALTGDVVASGPGSASSQVALITGNANASLDSSGHETVSHADIQIAAGNQIVLGFKHGTLPRFSYFVETDGSVWNVSRYDNAGAFVDNPLSINRATGASTFKAITVTSCSGCGGTVPTGGTGAATFTAHGALLGEGTSPIVATGPGVVGQCLTSNGASSDPTFQACGAGGGANLNLSNLSSVSINTTLLAQAGVSLGAAATPFTDLYLVGAGTYGTTSIHFSGTPTAARSVTTPDVSGVMLVGAALTSGNAVAADSTGNVVDFGFIPNTHTYEAGCTGTAASSVSGLNIQLWPPTNCSTTSATFEQLSVLVPVASKARNLRVRSNANGAAAGSGVFTVFTRSGGATALTCTIGTGSTCSDTTHTVSVSAGEQLYVLFNTAGSETLQDINVVFEF